ncbi:hypothetical protein CC77DRAFT_1092904, partial [Alternaria alternata]
MHFLEYKESRHHISPILFHNLKLKSILIIMYLPTTIAALLAASAHASILGVNTFSSTSCQAFQENIHITQPSHNRGNFPGGRRSFQIVETDADCSLIVFEGRDNTGGKLNFGNQKNKGTCWGATDGRVYQSFDVYCA